MLETFEVERKLKKKTITPRGYNVCKKQQGFVSKKVTVNEIFDTMYLHSIQQEKLLTSFIIKKSITCEGMSLLSKIPLQQRVKKKNPFLSTYTII